MNFLTQLLRGISFVPELVTGIEQMFKKKSGAEKKDAAISFLESALETVEAVSSREITDPEKFRLGLEQVINGVVACLNASAWAKGSSASSTAAPAQPA